MNLGSHNHNTRPSTESMKSPAKSSASSSASTKVHSSPNELNFTRIGAWRINMEIATKRHHDSPLYSIDVSGLFSDNTEITLYTGPKKDDRVLGRCRFNKFRTSEMQVSANGGASSRMIWIKHHECYRWSISRKSQAGGEERYFYGRLLNTLPLHREILFIKIWNFAIWTMWFMLLILGVHRVLRMVGICC